MRYFMLFFIFGCLCNSLVDTTSVIFPKIWKPSSKKGFLYDILITLLKKCDFNPRKIIINDEFYYIESSLAIAEVQPQTSVTVIRNAGAWRSKSQYRFDDIEIDAVILVIDMTQDPWPDFNRFFLRWRFKRNSLIFIIPKQLEFCSSYQQILLYIMRFYFSAAYYICVKNGIHPLIYTHDPFGDTNPPHWYKIKQQLIYGKNWSFYGRGFVQDLSEICLGFNFNRTNPSDQKFVITAIPAVMVDKRFMRNKYFINEEELDESMDFVQYRTSFFRKLLKLRFQYVILNNRDQFTSLIQAYDQTSIDTMLISRLVVSPYVWWHYFHPETYEYYGILSHNRGFMTPLEKIVKFYGMWTLLSLTIMLSITFIVMWVSTKNVSLSVFNVIRLLINSEVIVPLDTRSRKIFFTMVFLYFLIIHATFSGHLAEFLTSVDRRSNIESLEELKDPKIKKIYQFGYNYDDDFKFLKKKSLSKTESFICEKIIKNQSSVCIAPLHVLEESRVHLKDNNNTLYISKKQLGFSMIATLYRPGFPLREKINWAIMFMFDTNIILELVNQQRQTLNRLDKSHGALIAINYRVVNVDDIYFAFIFLIVGNCVGIICFLFEIIFKKIYDKVKNWHRQKDNNILSNFRHCTEIGGISSKKELKNIRRKIKKRRHINNRNNTDIEM